MNRLVDRPFGPLLQVASRPLNTNKGKTRARTKKGVLIVLSFLLFVRSSVRWVVYPGRRPRRRRPLPPVARSLARHHRGQTHTIVFSLLSSLLLFVVGRARIAIRSRFPLLPSFLSVPSPLPSSSSPVLSLPSDYSPAHCEGGEEGEREGEATRAAAAASCPLPTPSPHKAAAPSSSPCPVRKRHSTSPSKKDKRPPSHMHI